MTRPDSEGHAGRPPAGQITTSTLADGTHAFRLRFQAGDRRERVTLHERRDCSCGCGGGWNERTARVELDNILARVRAGVWPSRATRRTGRHVDRLRARAHLPRVRLLVADGEDRGRDRRQADRRQHAGRLPLAADRSPAALLRRLPAGRDRPPRVPALQGDQAARVRGAAACHRRGRRAARPARAADHSARAGVDQEAHRDARQHSRRGHRGRAHRAQPGARESHAHQGAQAHPNVPGDGRARGTHRRRRRAGRVP